MHGFGFSRSFVNPGFQTVSCFVLQVLFKLLLGSAKYGEAALFLSVLAVFNILFVTCIPVILYFTKVEYWSSFDAIPWGSICGFSVLLLSKYTFYLANTYTVTPPFPILFPGTIQSAGFIVLL